MERNWVGLLVLITLHLLCCCHGAALSQSDPLKCLKQTCGNVSVSYPFKLDGMDNCSSFAPLFSLQCKQGDQLYLTNMTYNDTNVDVRILHLDTNNLIVDATGLASFPTIFSPNGNGSCLPATDFSSLVVPIDPFSSPFFISDDNLFGSFGCSLGFFMGVDVHLNASASEPDVSSVELGGCSVLCPSVIFVGLLLGGVVVFAIWWRRRTKRKYFLQNGGVQLQDMIVKAGGKWESRLFTAQELKEATENYADRMKLGMGGFGTVFKGVLSDGRLVAIKKANRDEGGNEQFLNELQILMHINHRNIVRLLGCCMETAMPLLVYEYVSRGNLRENLDEGGTGVKGWEQRLKVAQQTAEALAYLHAAAFPPILHRDVKSANVLLDDNLDAKVADFGVSRLVPDGVQHVSTAVQGTIGYLDPEYFQTLQLTDKSDVYSLGVMLVELISGLKPVDSRTREPRFTNLALLFINHMQEARGEDLIDPRLVEPSTLSNDKSSDLMTVCSSIMAVAGLAHQCLALHGDDRPSMSLLADELRHIARALRCTHYDKDMVNDSPLRPLESKLYKHGEASAVITQDAEVFVKSISSTISISNLNAPTMPR
ncbi:hypothetical protein L7F22_029804 [Adiantum nelumboides]|nr:hypothetical protein [Adiantum nelumboides]